MQLGFIVSLIILVLTLILVYYIKNNIKNITYQDLEIPKFSSNVVLPEFSNQINIENKYDCNVETLRECKLDDPTTVFGCKEFTARCHHFDKDTEFIQNENTVIIPKNKDENTGYALVLTKLIDQCNPYHGDLVLVTASAESNEYTLLCRCKNPGLIGNLDLFGSCSEVFICDGSIDDLNKPVEEINCKCEKPYIASRYESDKIPYCKIPTILEANTLYNNWDDYITFKQPTLDINNFLNTYKDNLKITKLLNPCAVDLVDVNTNLNNKVDVNYGCSYVVDDVLAIPDIKLLKYDTKKQRVHVSAGMKLKQYLGSSWISQTDGIVHTFAVIAKLNSLDSDTDDLKILKMADPVGMGSNINEPKLDTVVKYSCELRNDFDANCYKGRDIPRYDVCNMAWGGIDGIAWHMSGEGRQLWGQLNGTFASPSIQCNTAWQSHINLDRIRFAMNHDNDFIPGFVYTNGTKNPIYVTKEIKRKHDGTITPAPGV